MINAGSAIRGTFAAVVAAGARPVAAASLLVLGETAGPFLDENALRLDYVASLPNKLWEPARNARSAPVGRRWPAEMASRAIPARLDLTASSSSFIALASPTMPPPQKSSIIYGPQWRRTALSKTYPALRRPASVVMTSAANFASIDRLTSLGIPAVAVWMMKLVIPAAA